MQSDNVSADLTGALSKAAEFQDGMAESLHNIADLMVVLDPATAQQFYQAADQARAGAHQFRLLSDAFRRLRWSFHRVFCVGVGCGLLLCWFDHLLTIY